MWRLSEVGLQTRVVSERVIVLAGERAPSLNDLYAGMHYRKRMKIAKEKHWLVLTALDPEWQPFEVRVDILIVATYKKQPVDTDNIVAKLYIDGLKDHVIVDDSMKYVRRVILEAEIGSEDRVTIVVAPIE